MTEKNEQKRYIIFLPYLQFKIPKSNTPDNKILVHGKWQ